MTVKQTSALVITLLLAACGGDTLKPRLSYDRNRCFGRLRVAALGVLASVLTGCIAIPHPLPPEELPFSKEQIAFIEPGETTRQKVEQELGFGIPAADRYGNRINVYGAARTVAGVLFFVGTYTGGGGGEIPIRTKHLLVVQYTKDDLVKSADVFRGDEGCTLDGICVKADISTDWDGGLYDHNSYMVSVILFARPAKDIAAKAFRPYKEQCSIYLYKTGQKGRLWVYMYTSGEKGKLWLYPSGEKTITSHRFSRETLPIDKEGFLHWVAEPGPVTFFTNLDSDVQFELRCEAGEMYFLNIGYIKKLWRPGTVTFSIDGAESGKQLVGDRRLTLDSWISEEFAKQKPHSVPIPKPDIPDSLLIKSDPCVSAREELTSPEMVFELATSLHNQQRYKESYNCYEEVALSEAANIDLRNRSRMKLGFMNEIGLDRPQDLDAAGEWYSKAGLNFEH